MKRIAKLANGGQSFIMLAYRNSIYINLYIKRTHKRRENFIIGGGGEQMKVKKRHISVYDMLCNAK